MMPEQQSTNHMTVSKTILIVDDDGDIADFLARAILSETPYQPVVASSASQVSRLVQSVKPDLLVLDYHLPGMDGIELYDWLHVDPTFEDIPALLLTASKSMPRQEIKQRQIVGLGKPIDLDEFLALIQKLLQES